MTHGPTTGHLSRPGGHFEDTWAAEVAVVFEFNAKIKHGSAVLGFSEQKRRNRETGRD